MGYHNARTTLQSWKQHDLMWSTEQWTTDELVAATQRMRHLLGRMMNQGLLQMTPDPRWGGGPKDLPVLDFVYIDQNRRVQFDEQRRLKFDDIMIEDPSTFPGWRDPDFDLEAAESKHAKDIREWNARFEAHAEEEGGEEEVDEDPMDEDSFVEEVNENEFEKDFGDDGTGEDGTDEERVEEEGFDEEGADSGEVEEDDPMDELDAGFTKEFDEDDPMCEADLADELDDAELAKEFDEGEIDGEGTYEGGIDGEGTDHKEGTTEEYIEEDDPMNSTYIDE